ncbi:MAG TPA: lipase maturation factor family protein [bacterium]|nr:lipase maturation factor family protein [bacterium]
MIFDGACGFCRKWINRWKILTGDRLDYQPFQKVAAQYPEIPLAEFEKAVQYIGLDGEVSAGAKAVFKSLAQVPGLGWIYWAHEHLPGFAFLSEGLYAFVASHRHLFSSFDSCGLAGADNPPTYTLSSRLFLKILALIYLTAFGTLWFQVTGLIGEEGILPSRHYFEMARDQVGSSVYWLLPSLCWFNSGDGFLRFLCGAGCLFSTLLFLELMPAFCLILLWFFYLSLVSAGQDFLSFQWDNLLLESGFLSIFLVSWETRPIFRNPSPIMVLLFQWLVFRLMFSSGVVKLASGDPMWHSLTALKVHYETQPLPPPTAWFMNQLPGWFQMLSCLYMFGVELGAPFLIFGPRRFRPIAFWLLASLQLLIMATGNYCFFNYLSLGLCFFILEDAAWPRRFRESLGMVKPGTWKDWPDGIRKALLILILVLSIVPMGGLMGWERRVPSPLWGLYQLSESFRLVNHYGLFAVMTTSRPEIIVRGSMDEKKWKDYEFKWKAGDLAAAPHWVAPYQPRLDWQMWFAALGDYRHNPWFLNFLVRLLRGSPQVTDLLKTNPFPNVPPLYVKADLYDYHFTNFKEKAQTGNWWKREYKGVYLPPISLKNVSEER